MIGEENYDRNNGIIKRPIYVKYNHFYKKVMLYWWISPGTLSINVKEVYIPYDVIVFTRQTWVEKY